MSLHIIEFIKAYGYLAIFLLIYAQEIGIPVPFPNELLMLFSGYLAFSGTLFLPLVLTDVIGADFLGTLILYLLFYFSGNYLLAHKPRWLPLSVAKLDRIQIKMTSGGWAAIFLCRLTPFIRGYTSVVSGLLRLNPKRFVPLAFLTSAIVCATYTSAGFIAGPYWPRLAAGFNTSKPYILGALFSLGIVYLVIIIIRHSRNTRKAADKARFIRDQTIRLHMVSETAYVTQGQGVHTAFIELLELLREEESIIIKVNEEGSGNIFHSHTYGPYYFWKGRPYKGRRILTAHVIPDSSRGTIPFWRQLLPVTRWYLKLAYSFADVVIAISPTVETEIKKLDVKTKIVRIYNPVLLNNWKRTAENRKAGREKLGIKRHERLVIGVGQLQERKGVEDFIDMAAAMPDAKFVWIGGRPWGVFTEGIQRINKKIENGPANLFFTGLYDLKDMPPMYAAADIFLFPSYQENCPLAPLEAAAAGLPVVFRDIPEYESLYSLPYLKAADTASFIAIAKKLITDPIYYAEAIEMSAALIVEFDKDRVKKELMDVYRDTLRDYLAIK